MDTLTERYYYSMLARRNVMLCEAIDHSQEAVDDLDNDREFLRLVDAMKYLARRSREGR